MFQKNEKIALINPPLDSLDIFYNKMEPLPPLAFLSLATFLKEKKFKGQIEILDGQILSMQEILESISKLQPDIVGISPLLEGYGNTLEIARLSKSLGAMVVLGGHHAFSIAKEILLARGPYSADYCVDCIVQNDGEEAFYKIVSDLPLEEIPNVIFSPAAGIIKTNRVEVLDFNNLPIADRGLINLDPYFKNFRVLNVYSKIGCGWRNLSGKGCLFCSRMHSEMRTKSPERFWSEIVFLTEKYGLDAIMDGRDDFLDDKEWLTGVHYLSRDYKKKPFMIILGRADKIDFPTVKILQELRVSKIILGLESGDSFMLRNMCKGISLDANQRAIEILSGSGITVVACFVLGAPQECRKSLDNTLQFAAGIKKIFQKAKTPCFIAPNYLKPHPGSLAFELLAEKTGQKYRGKDLISGNQLVYDWIENFCKVDFQEIRKVKKEIVALNKL